MSMRCARVIFGGRRLSFRSSEFGIWGKGYVELGWVWY